MIDCSLHMRVLHSWAWCDFKKAFLTNFTKGNDKGTTQFLKFQVC